MIPQDFTRVQGMVLGQHLFVEQRGSCSAAMLSVSWSSLQHTLQRDALCVPSPPCVRVRADPGTCAAARS
eukprot:14800356-Alexandrium_andersonii.AAC.1